MPPLPYLSSIILRPRGIPEGKSETKVFLDYVPAHHGYAPVHEQGVRVSHVMDGASLSRVPDLPFYRNVIALTDPAPSPPSLPSLPSRPSGHTVPCQTIA